MAPIRNLLVRASSTLLVALAAGLPIEPCLAQLKVGVTLSTTGGAASLESIERNVANLWPKTLGGMSVEYIVLDDASEPSNAVKNARRLVSEDRVDVIFGSSTSPNAIALVPVAEETGTPLISLASAMAIVAPMDKARRWVFKTVHNDSSMIEAVLDDMQRRQVKRLGYIGLADATGEGYLAALQTMAASRGIELVRIEKYNRADTSVTAQVLRVTAASPEAIFVASLGTPAALPQIELVSRGYKGMVYHTGGVANNDFLRVAGAAAEGLYLPVAGLLVADQLPDSNPVRKVALALATSYEARYGAGTRNIFIAYAQDALVLLQAALPAALRKGQPGSREFREALRDALEDIRGVVGSSGVYSMSPTDHVGLDAKSLYIAQVRNGRWTLPQ